MSSQHVYIPVPERDGRSWIADPLGPGFVSMPPDFSSTWGCQDTCNANIDCNCMIT